MTITKKKAKRVCGRRRVTIAHPARISSTESVKRSVFNCLSVLPIDNSSLNVEPNKGLSQVRIESFLHVHFGACAYLLLPPFLFSFHLLKLMSCRRGEESYVHHLSDTILFGAPFSFKMIHLPCYLLKMFHLTLLLLLLLLLRPPRG